MRITKKAKVIEVGPDCISLQFDGDEADDDLTIIPATIEEQREAARRLYESVLVTISDAGN